MGRVRRKLRSTVETVQKQLELSHQAADAARGELDAARLEAKAARRQREAAVAQYGKRFPMLGRNGAILRNLAILAWWEGRVETAPNKIVLTNSEQTWNPEIPRIGEVSV